MNERADRLNARAVADKIMEQDGKLLEQQGVLSSLASRIAVLEQAEAERKAEEFARRAKTMGSGPTA